MSLRSKGLFIFVVCVCCSWVQAGDLSKPHVREVIRAVERATNDLDVEALALTMADDVVIEFDITMLGESKVVRASKDEYVEVLAETWSRIDQYNYSRSDTRIKMVGDHAIVSARVHESMVIDGHHVDGTSKEKVVIRMIAGQPKITKVYGLSSL